jgi:hypothetical protein
MMKVHVIVCQSNRKRNKTISKGGTAKAKIL